MGPMLYWQWLAIGLVFLILEMLVPGAVLMWFGIGAILLGGLLLMGLEFTLPVQLLIFSALSLVGLVVGRRFINWNKATGDKPNLSRRGDAHIGKTYFLVKAIESGRGTVRVGDSDWRVSGNDLPVGSKVKVIGIDGATLEVEAVEEQSATSPE